MSDKMRRYTIAFWILLILSVSHFALAAPVAVGEILEVRSIMMDVAGDGMDSWEKRMDSGKDQWSTNQASRKPEDDNPGSNPDPDDAPGSYNEEDMLGSESSAFSEQTESDARGPDLYYNDPLRLFGEDSSFDTDLGDGAKSDDSDSNDGAKSDDSNDGSDNDSGDSNGNGGFVGNDDPGGYDGDVDNSYGHDGDDSDDTVHSGLTSTENTYLGPKSEHPAATPEHITDLEKILHRFIAPRNSGSGAVGTPKRKLQAIID